RSKRDWSSDVCSSDLAGHSAPHRKAAPRKAPHHKHRLLGLFARSTPVSRNPRVSISARMFRPPATIALRVQPARQAQREQRVLLALGRHSHVRASRCHLLKVLLCNVSSKALVKSVLPVVVARAVLTALV